MAAEMLAHGGIRVDLYDAMPSVGRKFLLAGKGGLNLTHAEAREQFIARYAPREHIEPLLKRFGPDELRAWVHDLGIDTFVGSSGRVFPTGMKAAPLLRAWLHRLRQAGVRLHVRHRWLGWEDDGAGAPLLFVTPAGTRRVQADVVVLALGGASWPRLGSDAGWLRVLQRRGVVVAPLSASNCGFDVRWSEFFRGRFAGHPVKTVALLVGGGGKSVHQQGEFTITDTGVEGNLIYAVSAELRDRIAAAGPTVISIDLLPDWTEQRVADEVGRPRGSSSWARHLHRRLGLRGVKTALLHELARDAVARPTHLAAAIKALPLRVTAARPIDEAISSAGIKFAGSTST
jgi:uncharacterized flavoprotein (TIGR03862 family)